MHVPWLIALLACADGASAADDAPGVQLAENFWSHWGDGRAELDGYTLVTPRYGELRHGRAVLVFVTETFTEAQRVKSDGGHPDEFPVLKLNRIRDFQTGIYDYNEMTSTFVRLDGSTPPGVPVKVSLSVQEWCGHAYEQVLPRGGELRWIGHSYFDGEADRDEALPLEGDGILLDSLPIVVRGLVGPQLQGSVTLPAFPTLVSGRYAHVRPAWTEVTLSAAPGITEVTVPAGTFRVRTVTSALSGGATTTWSVEEAWPHRLIRWASTDGEVAELTGSERLPYWQEHDEGDEVLLEKMGMSVPKW